MRARTIDAGIATEAVDVILRDGGTLRLRPPATSDLDDVLAFFSGLSSESLTLRFHGVRRVEQGLVEPYLDPDWLAHGTPIGYPDGGGVARGDRQRLVRAA